MRELDDAALELRLRAVLKEHLGTLPLDLTIDELDRRREAKGNARRIGRGRGMTLLAAAALLGGGALAAGSGILRLPTVVPPVPSPSVAAVATASADATSPSPSESASPTASPIPVAGPGGVWMPTGSMVTPRSEHAAVRLQDGRVLVVGGLTRPDGNYLTSAELYDPATGTWSAAGSISMPLVAATLLSDGKVLVLVGDPNGGPRSAEVYDPASGTWTATGPMDPGAEEADGGFTALLDGRVLLAGRDGAQVYDPARATWAATGPMVRDAELDTYTVLQDGRVLVTGGDSAQVYDPASDTWSATGEKNEHGYAAAATLLPDGKVLVAGGLTFSLPNTYDRLDLAEIYDPVTGSWSAAASMQAKTRPAAAILQPDGKVVVVGSTFSPTSSVISAVEVYDPATDTWTPLSVRPGIDYNAATLLSDGTVLVTGHSDGEQPSCTADLYDPRTASLTTTSSMLRCGDGSITLLLDGTVLKADDRSSELYIPAGVALPPLPAFPDPGPPVVPSPTPVPTPLPPAAGPVPPSARDWTVTVDNQSSEPAALFVAEEAWDGLLLVGSATPNVVPAGDSVKVTFLFPVDGGWIYVNPRPGEGGALVNAADIGMPGKILIRAEGDAGWLSP